jgi:PHD/YefM family antitoxin component YafN of YafNO toxin-antitoxin module
VPEEGHVLEVTPINRVNSVRSSAYIRSWGYEDQPLTAQQEQKLEDLLDRYHAVQQANVVTEEEVTAAVLGTAKAFSELTVAEANRVAAHLLVRIALHTHFADRLPKPPPPFGEEVAWLSRDRRLMERVISRAGWDTAEYFMPAHPLD